MGHPRRKVAGVGKGVAAPSCDGVVRASGPEDFKAALRQCQRRIVHVRSEKVPVPSGHGPEAGHIGTYPVMDSELRCAEAALRHQTVGGTGLTVTPPTRRRCRTGGLGARLDETGGCRSLIQNNSVVRRTAW